jgi:hypothetical protein
VSTVPWRTVISASEPYTGRGSLLGPATARRNRWRELALECGHQVERTVRYGPHQDGYAPQRGGTQHRSYDDILPAPKRVRCEKCGPS